MWCLLCRVDTRSPDVCAVAPHPLAGSTVAGWLGCWVSVSETSLDVVLNNRGGVAHICLEFPNRLCCRWCGHRPEARLTPAAYTDTVDAWKKPNEDERGVDIGQIRGQLKLTVAERVREMVHAANVMMTMQENARRFREMQSR